MQKQHYSIFINAPVEKVWDTMLTQDTYKVWTEAFNPGSRFEGSWEQGSTIRFLGPDPEGGEREGGMLARIKENRPHEFISVEHYGIIKNGVEDTDSEEAKKWTPAYENYSFNSKDGGTEVAVDVDVADEFKDDFAQMWPAALEKLKEISEK